MAKILAIDDDLCILELISRCLTAEGHEVVTADGGAKGVKLATRGWNQPNLIILDVAMPEMSGIEVLAKLKAHEKTCAIPVLMLTALNDDNIMQQAMGNYALEFLTKPISMSDLADKVNQTLSNQ